MKKADIVKIAIVGLLMVPYLMAGVQARQTARMFDDNPAFIQYEAAIKAIDANNHGRAN